MTEEVLQTPSLSHEGRRSHKVPVLGVEIAPFRIPFHRRLETFAVLQWTLTFLDAWIGLTLFTFYLLFTSYYWVSFLVYTWIIIDRWTPRQGGRRYSWPRRWRIWEHMRNYFPIELHKTADLDPNQNYIIAFHPHGILAVGAFIHFGTEATGFSKLFPGIKPSLLILRGWFFFPFIRDYVMLAGICDSSKDSVDYLLSKNGVGNAACLVIGGAREALDMEPGKHRVLLNRRKGFIRKAMEHGASLVPVYSFGESDVYDSTRTVPGSKIRKLQEFLLKCIGFTVPICHGRGIFNYTMGIIPYRRHINTVVGKPIPVGKNPNPTRTEVEDLHSIYVNALKALFDEHKTKYGISLDISLEII
ncbi:2-acylglycerol O-acyltransferase 2-A-like [Amphiura filiformis]|uniref:2-acylglycerol O-acyltransferase 2-A-like n=1 Tax=Amphiura filiformis TaxID=82378 RepID=UPI003B214CA8